MKREELKILLMQIRKDARIKIQEREAFCSFSKLDETQVDILDVFEEPEFNSEILSGYDALYIGGTSESNVLKPDENPFLPSSYKLINFCLENNIPVFASCFGFQMAVVAMGGEVLHQEKDFEMGTLPISLTGDAKSDLLFEDTKNEFYAVSVHKQKVTKLPDSCINLAFTDQCIHAFKVKDKPFWGFQFHPEVSRAHLVERLGIYQSQYTDNGDHFQRVIDASVETPESAALLTKFVDRVLLRI